MKHDTRGLATGLFAFIAIIVAMALLYTLFQPAAQAVFDTTSTQASSTTATDAINLREQIFELMLYFGVFLAMLALLARAVVESRRPG